MRKPDIVVFCVCVCVQVEQKVNCDEYLSLIYLSIDAVTEGMLPFCVFDLCGKTTVNEGILVFVSDHCFVYTRL